MNYIEIKKDNYNFNILLNCDDNNKIKIDKFKEENIIGYYLPFKSEKEYDYVLNYLANIFNIKNLSPIYQEDSIFEEEIYCFVTNNILVKYYFDTENVFIEIKNDNINEKKYDEIVVKMTYDLYNKFGRGIKK